MKSPTTFRKIYLALFLLVFSTPSFSIEKIDKTLDEEPCFGTISNYENMSVSNTFNGNFYSATFIIDGTEYWVTYDSNTGEVNSNYTNVFGGSLNDNNELIITIEVECEDPIEDDVSDNPTGPGNGNGNGNGDDNDTDIDNGNGNGNGGGNGNGNNGHGNNEDGVDVSNPGQGGGGPNSEVDQSGSFDDENNSGNGGSNDDDNDDSDDDNDDVDDDNDNADDDNDDADDDNDDADDDNNDDNDDADDDNDDGDDDNDDEDDDNDDADDDNDDADDDNDDADDDNDDADDDNDDADDDNNPNTDTDVIDNDTPPCEDPEVVLGSISTWSTFTGTTYSFDFTVDGEAYSGEYNPNNGTVNSNYPNISGEFNYNSVYLIIDITNDCGSFTDTLYLHQNNQQNGAIAPPTVIEQQEINFSDLSTTEVIYLSVQKEIQDQLQFQLIDTNGSIRLVKGMNDGLNQIQINNIKKGIYIYQILNHGQLMKSGKMYIE